jgi:NADPH:quinone reductase-like Zn-dependent oxidoreductase
MRGTPFPIRLGEGLRKPGNPTLGADIAGRVEAVGSDVTQFQPGDEVFGIVGAGGFAEYVCAAEDKLALKPANVSFEAAAAAPVVAFTALQGLRDTGHIQPGQTVLVNGASGGVGSFAVQIAKSYGAEVTGVCSTRNLDLVRSIGADHVINYTQDDFTKSGHRYDVIYDVVSNHSALAFRRALKPNGICVQVGFSSLFYMFFQSIFMASLVSMFGNKKVSGMGMAKPNQADLLAIKELLETGKVVPVIDKHYPLSETADAIRHLETGHARGKVIITVYHNH